MTKAEFDNAFRSVVCQEFESIPTGEDVIAYSFSQKFQRKMTELIKSEKTVCWHWFNTAGKRVAGVVAVLVLVVSLALSVEAVRKPFVEFIIEIFDGYWRMETQGDTTKEITYECIPNYIPEGYVLQEERKDFYCISRTYRNQLGGQLILEQNITVVNDSYLDSEQGEITEYTVDGKSVVLYRGTNHNGVYASWILDGYNLCLTSYGDLPDEILLEIIKNYK